MQNKRELFSALTPMGTRIWSPDKRLLWRIVEVLEDRVDLERALQEEQKLKKKGVAS